MYIVFNQGWPIDNCTNVPGPIRKSSTESDSNESCTSVMTLSRFRVVNKQLLNKDKDVVIEQASLIILYSKSLVCISNNGKNTNHKR